MHHALAPIALAAAAFVAAPAAAEVLVFSNPVTVAQEVPTPTFNPGQVLPTGVANFTFDTNSKVLTWDVVYANLTGPIVAPGAHVHGSATSTFGVTAPVLFNLTDTLPQPATGSLVGSRTLTTTQEGFLFAGTLYVNLHTAQNQPGEIRGQVIVPEPASLGLLALGGLALVRRGR